MEFINENRKIFTILFIIAIIIIIAILWFPEKDIELSHYNDLSSTEIDQKVSKQYGDELLYSFYSQNISSLIENISSEYLEYNGISNQNYENWLSENEYLTMNIKFNSTTKYEYENINIYSIDAIFNGNSRKVNIIETYPEQWYYTFDTFVFFRNNVLKNEKENYGAIINSIYQDLNYIEFDCSIYINMENYDTIDFTKSDSIKLVMNDGTSVIMATNNALVNELIKDNIEYFNTKCVFNIPINLQKEIDSIVFYINANTYIEFNLSL